jgi:hypothetical protein
VSSHPLNFAAAAVPCTEQSASVGTQTTNDIDAR